MTRRFWKLKWEAIYSPEHGNYNWTEKKGSELQGTIMRMNFWSCVDVFASWQNVCTLFCICFLLNVCFEALGPEGLCCRGQLLLRLLLLPLKAVYEESWAPLDKNKGWFLSSRSSVSDARSAQALRPFCTCFSFVFFVVFVFFRGACCRWIQPVSSAKCFSLCTLFSWAWRWWRAVVLQTRIKKVTSSIYYWRVSHWTSHSL